ncbi:MAG: FecR domain-containing protein [Chitinophagaceae bacterium]
MNTQFKEVSEVITDDRFLSWYFREHNEGMAAWEKLMLDNHLLRGLSMEAAGFLERLSDGEINHNSRQVEDSLENLHRKLDHAPVIKLQPRRTWWKIAAAAAVLAIAGFFVFRSFDRHSELKAAYGQLSTNKLPDGSTLILNANSSVSLSNNWDGNNDREVWLEGEGFFQVAKTPEKKRFIVHTGNLDVIVTGTRFNVSNRDHRTTVLLTEGSVTILMKNGREVKMKPGDFIEMDKEQFALKTANEDNVLAWKDNRMAFDNASMAEVAKTISTHYGVRVVLGDDNVRQQSITAIVKNNNLDELLKAIEMATPVTIVKTKDQITISSNMQ